MRRRIVLQVGLVLAVCLPAWGWGERGHGIVTRLAVSSLSPATPSWLKDPATADRLVYLCAEPDRWRNTRVPQFAHVNEPNHYLDVESLTPFGLSLKTLPRFRYEFVGRLASERAVHPDRFTVKPGDDPKMTRVTPGTLPYEIYELYGELQSSWSTLRTLEERPALATPAMIMSARERVIQTMGLMSHYVGDAAQPLHTTEHHHGWIGANPNGYTTDKKFHSYIDDGVLTHHRLTYQSVNGRRRDAIIIPAANVWDATLDHIDRSFRLVEPLYKLEKSGQLKAQEGKIFIEDRLLDGGAMLAGLWNTAYQAGEHDKYIESWLKSADRKEQSPASQPK